MIKRTQVKTTLHRSEQKNTLTMLKRSVKCGSPRMAYYRSVGWFASVLVGCLVGWLTGRSVRSSPTNHPLTNLKCKRHVLFVCI